MGEPAGSVIFSVEAMKHLANRSPTRADMREFIALKRGRDFEMNQLFMRIERASPKVNDRFRAVPSKRSVYG